MQQTNQDADENFANHCRLILLVERTPDKKHLFNLTKIADYLLTQFSLAKVIMDLNSAVTAIYFHIRVLSSPFFDILNLTPPIGPLSPSLCVACSEAGVLKKLSLWYG